MSAKQVMFVRFIDSRLSTSDCYPHNTVQVSDEKYSNDTFNYFLLYRTTQEEDYLFSMIYARSIVMPKPREECGIWPFDNTPEQYPEFIIGELPDGNFERFTCDNAKLADYFGGNPDAPHYLTPVFFKPSVLDKYRKNPVFEVSERRLRCGSQWEAAIDNIDPNRVMVYLGDLGRDLPEAERLHFLSFEMSPADQRISKEVLLQDFYGAWLRDTDGPIGKFRIAYGDLNDNWKERFGNHLFKELHPDDTNLLKQVRIPSMDSQEEFETIIQSLSRLLVDYIDESQLPKCESSGSINRLSAFLESQGIVVDLSPLRDIQELRSRGTAHAKGSKYDRTKARLLTGNTVEDAKMIISSLTSFMEDMSAALQYV